MPLLPGTQSLTDVEPTARRGTEDWASSCPAEWAADLSRPQRSVDIDGLFRKPDFALQQGDDLLGQRVADDSACGQSLSAAQTPVGLFARQRESASAGTTASSMAPKAGLEVVGKYEPVPLIDTCAFDAEYQARQTDAETARP